MNCSKFKSEFNSGANPDGRAAEHLENCDGCRRFADEEKALDTLLGSLPKIDAPASFGTGVNLRISAGKGRLSPVWATLRIALPVAAMLLIFGFVVMNSSLFVSPENSVLPVAKVDDARENENGAPAVDEEAGQDAVVAKNEKEVIPPAGNEMDAREPAAVRKPLPETARKAVKTPESPNPGGIRSIDQASEEADVTNPPGLNPEKKIEEPQPVSDKPFTAQEILATLGIEAEWKGANLVVGAVMDRGIGDRSGVRSGDHVRSIDGRAVSRGAMSLGSVDGKIIVVRRGGKDININIRSN